MHVQCTMADREAGTLIGEVYKILGEQLIKEDTGFNKVYHLKDKSGDSFYACATNFSVIPDDMLPSAIESVKDSPTNPHHYKTGGIETWDYLEAKLTTEQFEGYLLGNVLKYCSRYQHKNGIEDLNKAEVYLKKLISTL